MAKRIIRIALEVLSLLILLGTVAFLIIYWKRIPAQVPMHFNGRGEVEGMSGKVALLVTPVVMAVVYVSLFFTKTMRFRSLGREVLLPAPALLFPTMKLALLAGLAYLTVCAALVRPVGAWFLPIFLAATLLPMLIVTVLTLPKLKQ